MWLLCDISAQSLWKFWKTKLFFEFQSNCAGRRKIIFCSFWWNFWCVYISRIGLAPGISRPENCYFCFRPGSVIAIFFFNFMTDFWCKIRKKNFHYSAHTYRKLFIRSASWIKARKKEISRNFYYSMYERNWPLLSI